MIRISDADFQKTVKMLEKEAQKGYTLSFQIDGSSLKISSIDRSGKGIIIEVSDVQYSMMPRITRTETF